MKTRFFTLLFGTILCSIFCGNLSAQTGNDNPTGPAGIFNGNITTAGNYDPFTTNIHRELVDIAVANSVGTQPLALVRTYNSRNPGYTLNGFGWGGWQHNYAWSLNAYPQRSLSANYHPSSYTVAFPDGRAETFTGAPPDPGPWPATGAGVVERFMPLNLSTMKAYLLLNDGSQVEFTATPSSERDLCDPNNDNSGICTWYSYSYTASAIIDPYGLKTTLTYNTSGLRVTEPAGRALQFYNTTTAWGDKVIDHVTSTDGRTVQYTYVHNAVAGATMAYTRLDSVTYFGDSTLVARYTYVKPNTLPSSGVPLLQTCVDPMYAGPMWMIAYGYATANNPDGSVPVYGQIADEYYYNGSAIGGALSKLEVTSATKRKETRGDGPGGVGPSRTFTYTGNLLTSCTDFNAKTASQGYDANGFVNSVTDRNNHTTNYTRNPITGNVTQVTFPATPGDAPNVRGTVKTAYSDAASCTDPGNADASNPYYVCTGTDEAGNVTKYARITTPLNNKRVSSITYPDGSWESFAYNKYGGVTSHRLTTGGTETYAYYLTDNGDPWYLNGLVKEYRDPYHASGNPNARYQYDGYSRLYGVTDALGASFGDPAHTTNYSYNKRGQLLVTTHPTDPNDGLRHTIRNNYNPNGTLANVTDELGHVTSYTYDYYKRLYQRTTPARFAGDSGHTTTFNYTRPGSGSPSYHTANFPFSVTTPAGTVIYNDCDANFRKTSTVQAPDTAEEALTNFVYDNVGNLTAVGLPNEQAGQPFYGYWARTTYDERNRPSQAKDALGNPTDFRYDAYGRKASVTRANGQVITYNSYDPMNRLLQQTATQAPEPAAITKYTYDPSGGKLQTMTDPNGNVYSYVYDYLNQKAWLTYPPDAGGVQRTEHWLYNYTGNGMLSQFKNRVGNVETFTYDNLNRVTLSNWNDTVTPDVTTAYDAASRVTSITNSNSTITRTYFNDNLLNTETNKYGDNISRTVTYTYDADGRRATLTYPNNAYSFSYTYTKRSQLDTIVSGSTTIANYGYDLNGNLTTRTLDNSTSSTYGYDALNRCTSISHALVGTTRTFGYGYDVVGNRDWAKRDGNLGDVYDYDKNDQAITTKLDIANPDTTAPGPQTIVYDANGNRTSFAPPYVAPETYDPVNALNQYTKRNGSSAGYDANGNMTTGFDGSTYTYDAQNRLLSAKEASGPLVTFLYDGLNRQIGKKIGAQALYYRVYDGWGLLGEYRTGTSNAIFAYLYGTSGIVKNVATNYYYYQDGSGSTSHIANSAGALKEYYRYDLHGQPMFFNASGTQLSDTVIGVRHLFTGQQWYNELGLYDLRNRYYSPDIGRFLQSDPIRFGGDASNLYRYCGNNPSRWSDPSGLLSWNGIVRWLGNLIGPTDTVPRVTVTGRPPNDIGQGLTSDGLGDWQPRNPIDPSISSGNFPGFGFNPFAGIGNNPFGRSPFTIQTGVAALPAVNPTTPYSSPAQRTYFVGLNVSVIPIAGGTLSVGAYFSPTGSGLFATSGPGIYMDNGISATAGYVNGDRDTFVSPFTNDNVGVLIFEGSIHNDPVTGTELGRSYGIGIGIPPITMSETYTNTVATPEAPYPTDEAFIYAPGD